MLSGHCSIWASPQLVKNLIENIAAVQAELGPEELNQRVLEKFQPLTYTVFNEYSHEKTLNVLEVRGKSLFKLRFNLTLRDNR